VPIATVGSISDIGAADRIIAEGKADVVAMARAIFADPEMVNKTRRGKAEDVRPCLRCHTCNRLTAAFYPIRCAVNPILGRELDYAFIQPAMEKKKVIVVGGGPAGMQAAMTAAERGHDVTLFEKKDSLGGNLLTAAGLAIKSDMQRYLAWLVRQTRNTAGITIKLETEATPNLVKELFPDAIIVAVGADQVIPPIPGVDRKHVVWAGDVDAGLETVGQIVLVAGGGSTGGETALQLAKDGKKVTMIEMLDRAEVLAGWPRGLIDQVEEFGVKFLTRVKLEEIKDSGAVVADDQWRRYDIPADTIVLSLGLKPRKDIVRKFHSMPLDVYIIGDCVKSGSIKEAIHDGFNVAVEI
jgi:NADPH-dependent 2,4-dienoyl-CoA reductase/sulfur reductase-like enzyme